MLNSVRFLLLDLVVGIIHLNFVRVRNDKSNNGDINMVKHNHIAAKRNSCLRRAWKIKNRIHLNLCWQWKRRTRFWAGVNGIILKSMEPCRLPAEDLVKNVETSIESREFVNAAHFVQTISHAPSHPASCNLTDLSLASTEFHSCCVGVQCA